MKAILLILIIIEAIRIESKKEARDGDKHGILSNLALMSVVCFVEFIGASMNFKYGGFLYIIYRIGLFNYAYSMYKYKHPWFLGTTSATDKIELAFVGMITKITTKFKKPIDFSNRESIVYDYYKVTFAIIKIIAIFVTTYILL